MRAALCPVLPGFTPRSPSPRTGRWQRWASVPPEPGPPAPRAHPRGQWPAAWPRKPAQESGLAGRLPSLLAEGVSCSVDLCLGLLHFLFSVCVFLPHPLDNAQPTEPPKPPRLIFSKLGAGAIALSVSGKDGGRWLRTPPPPGPHSLSVSLAGSPGRSWDHLPNKLLTRKSLTRIWFGENQTRT